MFHSTFKCPSCSVKPYLRAPPETTKLLTEGETGQLNCQFGGNPAPRISWSRLEGEIASKAIEQANGTLVIPNLSAADQGAYKCEAKNAVGKKSSQIIVKIRRGPKFTRVPIDRQGKVGDDVAFEW